jgi:BASS family bile acid:Na+ symporter
VFELFRDAVDVLVPVFVVSTMANVGLTQRLSAIIVHLKDWKFVLRMALANFVLVPLLGVLLLWVAPIDDALEAGLLVFSLCAGAPFLVKLTQAADHDIALGAATMVLLMTLTVAYVPLVMPLLLAGVAIDRWTVAWALLKQMILPAAAGMLLARFVPTAAAALQPWVGRLANVTLYLTMATTLIGFAPNALHIVGTGAIFLGLLIVGGAFAIGFFLRGREDPLHDVGGLGTAQRNTAAALIIAQSFEDPDVLVMVIVINTLGLLMLLFIASRISRENVKRLAEA